MLKALRKSKVALAYALLFGSIPVLGQENYKMQKADAALREYFVLHVAESNATTKDVAEMRITSDYTDATIGIRHIYAQQRLNGLDVVNGNAALHLTASGAPAHAVYQFAKLTSGTGTDFIANTTSATLSASEATKKAMENVGIVYAGGLDIKAVAIGTEEKTVFMAANTTWDIPTRKTYFFDAKTKILTLAWEVQLYRRDKQNYWIIYVDANTGTLVYKQDMVVKCDFGRPGVETDEHIQEEKFINQYAQPNSLKNNSDFDLPNPVTNTGGVVNQYRVINLPYEAINQTGAGHNLVSTGGDLLASPDGWHKENNAVAFQFTRGNNVWAFQDPSPGPLGGVPSADPTRTAYNNGGPLGTPVATEPFLFDYKIDTTKDPTTYLNAAIVNLFYLNNTMHDVFYHFGFTEAAQNFEDSHNFSTETNRGSIPLGQNDGVLAQAQDGGGTNNANFLTLKDGTNGQMQMYLWTGSVPDSLVLINSNTAPPPASGAKYFAVQGHLATPRFLPLHQQAIFTRTRF